MIQPIILVMALVLISVSLASASSSLRCGRALVSLGADKIEVKQKCGEPASRDSREVLKVLRSTTDRSETHIAVFIEVWTYHFGPRGLGKQLHFQNGKLTDIQSLGYGK